jgi:DNA-directed RNA polymerase beta' subunit
VLKYTINNKIDERIYQIKIILKFERNLDNSFYIQDRMPAGFNQATSDIESIVGVQFSILSPEEIERSSVVEIVSQTPYEGNEPKIGGLFDPRMGVLDNGKVCRTCGQTNHGCPGHFGHYRLTRPVYYIQFHTMIMNVLKCICIRCSKLRIDKDHHKDLLLRKGEARWKEVLALSSNVKRCGQECEDGCGAPQPDKFTREGIARIVAHYQEMKQQQPLEVEYVHRLFRRISDEDVDFMGLSRFWCRPDWMICTVLRIPPPQVRPSVVQDNNQRSEDDLTHKLFDIIKNDRTLQQKIEGNSSKNVIDEMTNVVQYHVATLVDNDIPGVAPSAQRSGRPLKSIQQRLGGKEGRIRYNIQGKRVEFSARSVITPDPNLSVGEIGVPVEIATNLTIPERVTPYNLDKLYKLVQNGADKWPGAKTIVRKDGRMISLKHVPTREIVLYEGDVVNRHLLDNDIGLFNRQPTLHKMSMMGHRVKVLPYKTFRMNVLTTRPYNADFDGDEMNFHVAQSYEAMVELEEIAAVPHHIITPRHAKPMIGVYQDTLVGSFRLTQPGIEFTRREFMNLMMWNKRFDGMMPIARGKKTEMERWTGQQVLGALMPPVNIEMGNKSYDSEKENTTSDNYVKIVDGDILQGVVDGDIYMKPSKGIVHVAYNDCGSKDTVGLLDALQNTVENFLVLNGFSVGISDLIADEETKKTIDAKIQEKKKQVEQVILQVHLDLFDNNTGKTNQQEFEDQIFGILNQATSDAGSTGQQSLSSENRLLSMVRSGSKGEPLNVAQMMACLGQTAIEGKRVPYGFTDRTLPHYKKYDDSSEARGFIESSFIRGLTPQQFFFHAMSGREGLIDTAVKTADTGYIQRQLIKSMEDLTVQHDGTVRDCNNNIIQYHYGEDGINPTKIETQSLPIGKLSQEEIRTQFGMTEVDWSTVLKDGVERNDSLLITEYVQEIIFDQRMMVEGVFQKKSLDSGSVFAPVNLARWILNTKVRFALNPKDKTDLTPGIVLEGIKKIIGRTHAYHKIWCALLRFHLAPHKLIVKERFTISAFEMLMELIVATHMKSWIQPGEQVGIVAAQSIGEPATQMSSVKDSLIVLQSDSGLKYYGTIGEICDSILEENKEKLIHHGENSVILPLEENYYIVGVSEDEKTSWKRISEISRHPANGGLVEVMTRTGRKTTATLTHSFLKRSPTGIVPVLGSELKVGMRIPIAKIIPEVPQPIMSMTKGNTTFTMNKEFGWICGIYLADGSFNGNIISISKVNPMVEVKLLAFAEQYDMRFETVHRQCEYGPSKNNNLYSKDLKDFLMETFNTGSYEKKIGATVFHANKEFIAGVIGGFFDGDGNVSVERQLIRASSRSETLIQQMTALLGYVGMFGVMSQESSVRIKDKIQHTLVIPRKFAKTYKEQVGFQLQEKADALDKIIEYNERQDIHSEQEMIDKIPELGPTIAETGKLLKMPGQSRLYGRWAKKESIGRQTLTKYVTEFEAKWKELDENVEKYDRVKVEKNMSLLQSALAADVLWDEITELIYHADPKEYVYDFTVPGNDSFMVDCNVLVHNTLNTFHQAGVASKSAVTRGVPRLRELLKVTQNPKASSLTIYLKPEYRQNKDKAREVVQELELTVLRNITDKVAIYWDEKDESTVVEEDKELMRFYALFEEDEMEKEKLEEQWSKWLLRLELNREEMFNRNISMQEVVTVIKNQFNNDINVVYSDYNSDKLVMRIRLPDKDKKDKDTASQLDDFTNLKKFQNKLLNSIVIRGVPGIKAVTFRNDKQYVEDVNEKYVQVEQYVLDTDGSNYIKVMNHPAVDGTKLYSTNVWDVYEVLGIEATRAVLFNEINGLFESVGVNYRHLCLLCDVMTRFGKLMSIDRYGINKNDIGTLAKASFEETEKILLKAALFGEVDPVTGVSANIMMGQPIRGGTAFSQILLDDQMLVELLKSIDVNKNKGRLEQEEEGDLSRLNETDVQLQDPCSSTQFKMSMVLPHPGAILKEDDVELIDY